MRTSRLVLLALALSPLSLRAQNLDTVLSQMDAASVKFKSARAESHTEFYERVLHSVSTVQNGPIYFERAGNSTQMGAVITETGATRAKVIEYKNGTLRMFDPGVNQITELSAGGNKGTYESFLTLGFGGSGKDLVRVWNITDKGPETIDGIKTEKLELVPKDDAVKKNFTHVTIWIDPSRAVSLKQIFYTPQGDYRTAIYTNIKLNDAIKKSDFVMHTDKKTTTVKH